MTAEQIRGMTVRQLLSLKPEVTRFLLRRVPDI